MAHRPRQSFGDSSSLFGTGNESSGSDDFFSSPQSRNVPPLQSNAGQHSHNGNPITTVLEEEEPLSPALGYGRGVGSGDWSQTQNNQYNQSAYSTSHSDSNCSQQQSYEQSYAQPMAYPDIPYYPGYLYDPASNSYVPDPNSQVEAWTPAQSNGYEEENAEAATSNGDWNGYDNQDQEESNQYQGQLGNNYQNEPNYQQGEYQQDVKQQDYSQSWDQRAPEDTAPYQQPSQYNYDQTPYNSNTAYSPQQNLTTTSNNDYSSDPYTSNFNYPADHYQNDPYSNQSQYESTLPDPEVIKNEPPVPVATLPPPRSKASVPPPKTVTPIQPPAVIEQYSPPVHSSTPLYAPHIPSNLATMSRYNSDSSNPTPRTTPPISAFPDYNEYNQSHHEVSRDYESDNYRREEDQGQSWGNNYDEEPIHASGDHTNNSWDKEPIHTSNSHNYHDEEAIARATVPESPQYIAPPRSPFEPTSSHSQAPFTSTQVFSSPPLPVVAPTPVENLVEQLNKVQIREQQPPVQLRRRSFGRQQSRGVILSTSASPTLETIPVEEEPISPTINGKFEIGREAAQSPSTRTVPELNFEAPSPELAVMEEEDIADEWGLEDPVIESEEELEEESTQVLPTVIDPPVESNDNFYSRDIISPPPPPPQSEPIAYGFDDSQVFEEDEVEDLSNSTSIGSGFGEWTGKSDSQQGYDYAAPSQPQLEPAYDSYNQSTYGAAPPQNRNPYSATPPPPAQYAVYGSPERNANFSPSKPTPQYRPGPPNSYGSPPNSYGSPPRRVPAALRSVSNDPYASENNRPSPLNRPPPLRSASATSYVAFPSSEPQQAQLNSYSNQYRENAPLSPLDPPSNWRGIERSGSTDPYATSRDPYAVRPTLDRKNSSNSGIGNSIPDLGLDRSRAPIVTFGFGGKMLVVFPNLVRSNYGMDSNLYGNNSAVDLDSTPSTVHIRKLVDYIPASDSQTFPGPIFMDGGKANAGKKRKEATSWLDVRITEQEQEATYFSSSQHPAEMEKKNKVDNRLILLKLVKLLVENEGKLTGTAKLDESVRSILAPNTSGFDASDAALPTASELASTPLTPMATGLESIATYTVSGSNLDKISAFLLCGDRRKAVQYALNHHLWAHAFIISGCVDSDCQKEVVAEFLKSELTPPPGNSTGVNGRESLRVAYSMFAGMGADSIQQFVPTRPFAPPQSKLTLPGSQYGLSAIPRAMTPVAPRFPDVHSSNLLPREVLAKWQETAALIIANRTAGDSAALTALGDTLASNDQLDAAHICYLLSPATSPLGGVGSPSARLSLVGGMAPTSWSAGIELESIMLTELVEFAFSLAPVVKGQEVFVGFPHLQAFRLYHASQLADAGQVSQAQRYTEAIVGTLKLATKPSPFYHPGLVAQVKLLSDRLSVAPGQDKAGSWIARKVPRPTIDSLWTTLEGRFTKFVSGDVEPSAQMLVVKAEAAKSATGPIGPFSHYSAISPASTSGTLSRQPSQTDLTAIPPPRPTSAAAHTPIGPPPVKRAPFKTHHSRSSSLGFAGYDYNPSAPPPWQSYAPPSKDVTPKALQQEFSSSSPYGYGQDSGYNNSEAYTSSYESPAPYQEPVTPNYDQPEELQAQQSSDWEGSSWQPESNQSTLQAPTFTSSENFVEDESGFMSPMAAFTPSPSPAPSSTFTPQNSQSHRRTSTRDELDDLGIGNSKSRKPTFDSIDEQGGEAEEGERPSAVASSSAAQSERPAMKQSRSWLGGWFKREAGSPPAATGPGAVRANLGEQTSFVFDPELKRWVNKKTGGDTTAPLSTAPPPRAATASPTRAMRAQPPRYGSEEPPPVPSGPPRPNTAIGMMPPLNRSKTSGELGQAGSFRSASTGPPPMAARSTSLMSAPPSSSGVAPPRTRKPLKSRYVATPI